MTRISGLNFWTFGGATALLALGATAFGGSIVSTSSEALLRSSFSTALGDPLIKPSRLAKAVPVAGTEEYWLTAMRQEGGAPVTKAVSVGDHISLSLGGHERKLEVASVSAFAPSVTEIDTTAGASHFVLVTARDSGNAAALPIRFVMELANAAAAVADTKPARAL